jgi:hypothetical protein
MSSVPYKIRFAIVRDYLLLNIPQSLYQQVIHQRDCAGYRRADPICIPSGIGKARYPDSHGSLSLVKPGGGTRPRALPLLPDIRSLLLCPATFIFHEEVNCDMLYEMGKRCLEKFVPKVSVASVLANMLCELGTQGENRCRKPFVDPLVARCNADRGAHRIGTSLYFFEKDGAQ